MEQRLTTAIERIKTFEPSDGYYVAFSGGKDSIAVAEITKMSGAKFELWHAHTTLDTPEVVRFIRTEYPQCNIVKPELSIWKLMIKKGFPPTHKIRYCCDKLKEPGGKGRTVITGVRWAEGTRRKKLRGIMEVERRSGEKRIIYRNVDNDNARKMIESCTRFRKHVLNPIVDWTDDEVWEFIRQRNLKWPTPYDTGYTRVGCIGCPMKSAKKRWIDFARYPTYKIVFIQTFQKIIDQRRGTDRELLNWKTGEELFDWWMTDAPKTPVKIRTKTPTPPPSVITPHPVYQDGVRG
jgi:phosphoadenosine phosphosulfate reductase